MLTIRCHFHPRYRAHREPKNDCETCRLLYALAHQQDGNTEEILRRLGSGLAGTTGDDKMSVALEGMETGRASTLTVKCSHHQYQATRKPGWNCDACWLLFVLKFQAHKDGERRLGPFNPYAYVIGHVNLKAACAALLIVR
ncbi:MAG: hypothetical protein PHT12_00815 [Patescibacteria group bacterium]|nr:hypothetical protein [Patescibacteria group bacterium]